MKRFGLGFIIAAGLTLPAFGQSIDTLIGSWKLNLEKSTGNILFGSLTLTWSAEGQNLIDTADGVTTQGQPFHVVFRPIYDRHPHPATGSQDYDSSTYTRIGNTINYVRFQQEKAVEVGQAAIVPGNTYTLTSEGINATIVFMLLLMGESENVTPVTPCKEVIAHAEGGPPIETHFYPNAYHIFDHPNFSISVNALGWTLASNSEARADAINRVTQFLAKQLPQ